MWSTSDERGSALPREIFIVLGGAEGAEITFRADKTTAGQVLLC